VRVNPLPAPAAARRAPSRSPDVVVRAERVAFTYSGRPRQALEGVSLDVRAGEVLAIEGPSGGGKSTLLRAFAGLVPHFHGGRFAGRVTVGGLDTRRAHPAAVARVAGVLFQDPEAQAVLATVERDVAFGPQNAGVDAAEIPGRVREALAAAGALHLSGRAIDTLSGGERQRAALAAVLANRPRALLLDEPTSQLDEAAAGALIRALRRLADERGVAVVVAEHRVERVRPIADRVVAVRDGRLATPAEDVALSPPAEGAAPPGPVAAALEDVDAGYGPRAVLRGCSLELRAGEVTALVGPNGSGKSTLVRVLAGLHAPAAGRVLLHGEDVTAVPAERRFPRVGLVGQDPGRHLLCERVDDEVAYALRHLGAPAGERGERVAAELEAHGLASMAARHPLELSVGERERVALAAVLVASPRVLVLDEPTRGMDPERKATLATLLRERARAGAAVLVATHDAAFAAAACGRRVAMGELGG
jgi:energy-coupling factor transport system ATP-binding protein